MRLGELLDTLDCANMLRVIKDGQDIYVGFQALLASKVGEHDKELYEKYKNDLVKRFAVIPEVTHRKWQEKGLRQPLQPWQTADYKFQDLQVKLYYTIYI